MKSFLGVALLAMAAAVSAQAAEEGFVSLFDGKTFDGWKVGKNADSFKIQDGMIVVNGVVAHLFYEGPVANHDFKNFIFKAEVMTFPHANSGIYFHTKYQEEGFPKFGLESQVNATHKDKIKTGSLYRVKDVYEAANKDGEWYTQEIIVKGLHVEVKVDGKQVLEYTFPPEAENKEYQLPTKMTYLPRGTFALQGHDPGSKVYFKNIRVKVLPD